MQKCSGVEIKDAKMQRSGNKGGRKCSEVENKDEENEAEWKSRIKKMQQNGSQGSA